MAVVALVVLQEEGELGLITGFACLICMAARLTSLAGSGKARQNPGNEQAGGNARLRVLAIGLLLGSTAALAQPKSAGTPDARLVEDLVAANRVLVDLGVLDGFGHVSVRHDKDANRYLMSRSMAPALVKADDILEFDLDSVAVDAKGQARLPRALRPRRDLQGAARRRRRWFTAIRRR